MWPLTKLTWKGRTENWYLSSVDFFTPPPQREYLIQWIYVGFVPLIFRSFFIFNFLSFIALYIFLFASFDSIEIFRWSYCCYLGVCVAKSLGISVESLIRFVFVFTYILMCCVSVCVCARASVCILLCVCIFLLCVRVLACVYNPVWRSKIKKGV